MKNSSPPSLKSKGIQKDHHPNDNKQGYRTESKRLTTQGCIQEIQSSKEHSKRASANILSFLKPFQSPKHENKY